jgi:integrase/recombinase XerC
MLAMLALLSQGGLRVHELVALDVRQVDTPSATLLGVAGKGGTIVDVPLNPETLALLADWLGERASVAGVREPALFVSSRGSRISIRSVQRRIENLRVAVGTAKHVTPHTFRHTAATLALTLGCDLATVGDMLRHADLNTTRRYVHLVDERRREAVRRLGGLIPRDVLPIKSTGDASIAPEQPEHGGLDAQYPLEDAA